MAKVTEIVAELAAPAVEAAGCELWDVEYVREAGSWFLRLYLDKEGGVDIIDCENVSRAFSDALDQEDFIPDAYILEVSSPGLGRTLKKDRHFEKSLGMEVEVKLFKAIDKVKEFVGNLESYDSESITISKEDGGLQTFNRSEIALVRLTIDF